MTLPRSPHVLVVDDETTIRIALRRFFERLGWHVDEATDGESALEMLQSSGHTNGAPDYHAVICDVRMPGLDGIGLHERLLQERPDLMNRVIFVTGDMMSEDMALFLESTSCLVLQKPFEFAQIRDLMTRLMDDGATSEALTS
jgi:CheY-like chemotaxis protein